MTKIAVITGAGSGIGRDTAHVFLKDGYAVALIGRRRDALEETAAGHDKAMVCPCDVSDPAAVEATFSEIVAGHGRIDVLFNNAGANVAGATPDEIAVDDWLRIINVNLNGAFFCARAAFAQMRAQDPQGGRIINNGSISAYVPRPGSAPYTSSKHAITGLTRSFSLDGRPYNIACGQIDIGNAMTELAAKMATGVPQADGRIAVEPMMKSSEVADAVLHMASLPLETNVQFMTIMASGMPFIGRG